jgi:outer membrane receptor for ferrienterochelin and colicin
MYFFVNDTSPASFLQNTFYIEYDDIGLIQYHGELSVEPSAKWNCKASFTYYSYNMQEEKKPWHKPLYDLTLNASYLLKEKIALSGGLLLTGKRYAKTSVTVNPIGYTTLDAFADINLGIKYIYSKLFTVFLDINNISDGSYMLWNQYPSQRFNMMIGFTYKL